MAGRVVPDGGASGPVAKVDLKRELGCYTAPRGRFELITVPPLRFLMIDGEGDPNTSAGYADALASLYPLAYALKFLSKRELGRDYTVMPLEGLWWADDLQAFTSSRDKSAWHWTLLNLVPQWLGAEHVAEARGALAARGAGPVLDHVRWELFDEGLCVQTLHVGRYDDEGPVLQRLHHEYVPEQGLQLTGRHHEVYLSDPRRAAPEKLRTILRQPVRRSESR